MAIEALPVSATSVTEQIKNLVLANAAAHVSSVALGSILASSPSANTSDGARKPYEIYNGGYSNAHERGVCVRIANGGGGQIGLLRVWADVFIRMMVEEKGEQPFEIAWYLGDTSDSLSMLEAGAVDMALTYIPQAELRLMHSGAASKRSHVYQDRFALVGPRCNPAGLEEHDTIYEMFHKIMTRGDADAKCPPDPDVRPACRFLSRFDKSAGHLKESSIWLMTGSVPWGNDYSRWYHQYVRFPREALRAASALDEYTLIDYGAWHSAPPSVCERMQIYKLGDIGPDAAQEDVLLNPAHLLYAGETPRLVTPENERLCKAFFEWTSDTGPKGGMAVTLGLERKGFKLYVAGPSV
ncbi:hypothetical protein D9619_011489 [Psilocybe cf. subviscida]|uniref:PBP domain-containing protein n=1 Tax=Psilocybe cf. subviscida TaxID=2480587 RepID=A0A8H5BT19_9AGAR|nr:hypothetical protein D9619_011489 [Psilocybe cf. subviscida]